MKIIRQWVPRHGNPKLPRVVPGAGRLEVRQAKWFGLAVWWASSATGLRLSSLSRLAPDLQSQKRWEAKRPLCSAATANSTMYIVAICGICSRLPHSRSLGSTTRERRQSQLARSYIQTNFVYPLGPFVPGFCQQRFIDMPLEAQRCMSHAQAQQGRTSSPKMRVLVPEVCSVMSLHSSGGQPNQTRAVPLDSALPCVSSFVMSPRSTAVDERSYCCTLLPRIAQYVLGPGLGVAQKTLITTWPWAPTFSRVPRPQPRGGRVKGWGLATHAENTFLSLG